MPDQPAPIPVICDRCGAQGLAGDADFAAFGDLLDFEPVPLQVDRIDGFKPEAQRAFIAALAILGSADRAAKAIGKSATGAERLRKLPGSEGFSRAWERAKTISQEKGTLRLAESLRRVTDPGPGVPPAPPDPGPTRSGIVFPPPETDFTPAEEAVYFELLESLAGTYMVKVEAERRARLEGRIAEADFTLRQLTMLEVSLGVVSGNGMAILKEARLGGHDLLVIAETPFSKLLDEARHEFWQSCGDPPRPDYPPRHLLVEHDDHATEPLPLSPTYGPGRAEARQAQEDQFKAEAEAQVEWEAQARRDYEERRDRDASS